VARVQVSSKQLLEAAQKASAHAHAPYSQFRVGAAVLTEDGKVFVGVNVENASYGLTVCAERVAIFAAIAAGASKIVRLAVSTALQPTTASEGMPCGACRQVMAEFMDASATVDIDHVGERTLKQLLPDAFQLSSTRE
jgi:cytidine deaminase